QDIEDIACQKEADHHQRNNGDGAPDQPLAQLDQMVEQRRLATGELVLQLLALVLDLSLCLSHRQFFSAGSAGFLRGAPGFAAGFSVATTSAGLAALALEARGFLATAALSAGIASACAASAVGPAAALASAAGSSVAVTGAVGAGVALGAGVTCTALIGCVGLK